MCLAVVRCHWQAGARTAGGILPGFSFAFLTPRKTTSPPANSGAGSFSFLQKADFNPPQFLWGLNRTDMQAALCCSVHTNVPHFSFRKTSLVLVLRQLRQGKAVGVPLAVVAGGSAHLLTRASLVAMKAKPGAEWDGSSLGRCEQTGLADGLLDTCSCFTFSLDACQVSIPECPAGPSSVLLIPACKVTMTWECVP